MYIIKYDSRDKKLYLISSVVSTAVFAIWIFLLWFGTGILSRLYPDEMENTVQTPSGINYGSILINIRFRGM